MRRSSSMTDVRRRHRKRNCKVFERLNLEMSDAPSYERAYHEKKDSSTFLLELKSKINRKIVKLNEIINLWNQNFLQKKINVRFTFLKGYKDYEHNLQVIYELNHPHYLFKTVLNFIELTTDLTQHMKHSSAINHQRNVLSSYLTYVKDYCEMVSVLTNALTLMESQLLKFLTVCDLTPPITEIKSWEEDIMQYENLGTILMYCHKINVSNNRIVFGLLELILSMRLENSKNRHRIRHENYDEGFLEYVVHHIESSETDINFFISRYHDTAWSFYSQFSVVDAIANGDKNRLTFLVNSGVEIFPLHEQMNSGHTYPAISQTLTLSQLLILELMEKIYQNTVFNINEEDYVPVSQEQKSCFEVIWQNVPEILFPKKHFCQALKREYEHLLSQGVEKIKCDVRFRRMKRYIKMYEEHFYKPFLEQIALKYL